MRNLYILLTLAFLPFAVKAQIETPNDGTTYSLDDLITLNDTVVTFTDGEYFIHYDVKISETDTFRIDQASTVRVAEDALITINGGLFINSNTLFTKIDTNYRGFRINEGARVHLEGATFEYGGGFKVLTGDFTMIDCIVQYQSYKTGSSGAVDVSAGKPYFENVSFIENQRSGIGGPANKTYAPQIFNCTFIGNGTSNQLRPQINLGSSGADTTRIINNTLIGNPELDRPGGIAFLASSLTHIIIADNEIRDHQYGLSVNGLAYTRITGNIIEDNNTAGNPMTGGSGINILGNGDMDHVILNNQIRGNLWGITTQGNGKVNLGDLSDENVGPGGNVFSNNQNGGVVYAFYNNTPNDAMAQGNCWIEENPDATEEEVAAVIVDQADDETLGVVDYSHFACGSTNGILDGDLCGFENFDNAELTTSYADGSFVGNDGITWSYIHSRDENEDANESGIDGNAIMLRRASSESAISSSTISGGIGSFAVKLYKGFTGNGDRQVELFINGDSYGVSEPFNDFDEHIWVVEDINVSGNFTLEIKNITDRQIILDDIMWTCYGDADWDCPDMEANIGDGCTDADENIGIVNDDCECEVTPIWDCPELEANIGDVCLINDLAGVVTEDCECEVGETFDCPDLEANIGDYCEVDGEPGIVNDNCACDITIGITEAALENVAHIYPNPTNGILNVVITNKKAETLAIYDLNGKAVETIKVVQDEIKLDLSKYAAGVYVIQISGADFVTNGKIVIQ